MEAIPHARQAIKKRTRRRSPSRRRDRPSGASALPRHHGSPRRRGDDADHAPAGRRPGDRLEDLSQIDSIQTAHLREQIAAPGQIGCRAHPELRREATELLAKHGEEPAQIFDGAIELARLEPLESAVGRFGDRLDLGRDSDVTGVELATAADRATDRDHGEGAEAHTVGAEAEHLGDVDRALHPAVTPEFDDVAKS